MFAIPVVAIATLDDLHAHSSPVDRSSNVHAGARARRIARVTGRPGNRQWSASNDGTWKSNASASTVAPRGGVTATACASVRGRGAVLLLPRRAGDAATYKWVDEKGVVHYTDKIPPEAVNKGNVELDKQGVPVKRNDPALTPEQRRAREVEEERAAAARQGTRGRRPARSRAARHLHRRRRDRPRAQPRARHDRRADAVRHRLYRRSSTSARSNVDAQGQRWATRPVPPVLERETHQHRCRARRSRPSSSPRRSRRS